MKILFVGTSRGIRVCRAIEKIGIPLYPYILPQIGHISLFRRAFYLPDWVFRVHGLAKIFGPDLILCESIGLHSGLVYAGSRLKHLPFILRLNYKYWEESRQVIWPRSFHTGASFNVYKIIGDFETRGARFVIPNSSSLGDDLLKYVDIEPSKVVPIPNPVDLIRFSPANSGIEFKQRFGIDEGIRIILSVTNFRYLGKVRGIVFFLPCVEKILDSFKDTMYVIAGDGPLLDDFRRLVSSRGYKRIIPIGRLDNIEEAYAASELLTHTSFFDALPAVVQEAEASGKPVVANDIGGVTEEIDDGKTGYVVDTYDRNDFVEKVAEILDNQKLRRKLGENARKKMINEFSYEVIGQRISKLLNDLL